MFKFIIKQLSKMKYTYKNRKGGTKNGTNRSIQLHRKKGKS